jgi:hypothetical protein
VSFRKLKFSNIKRSTEPLAKMQQKDAILMASRPFGPGLHRGLKHLLTRRFLVDILA